MSGCKHTCPPLRVVGDGLKPVRDEVLLGLTVRCKTQKAQDLQKKNINEQRGEFGAERLAVVFIRQALICARGYNDYHSARGHAQRMREWGRWQIWCTCCTKDGVYLRSGPHKTKQRMSCVQDTKTPRFLGFDRNRTSDHKQRK